MTAASEHPALDRERAETYLRLQAEAELRRALAMPEYKPPRERRASSAFFVPAQARRMRRRRAGVGVDRILRQQAASSGQIRQPAPPGPANGPERRFSPLLALRRISALSVAKALSVIGPPAQRLWQSANNARYRAGHQVRMTTWGLRARFPGWSFRRGHEQLPAHACAERVAELAGVLAAIGAISLQTEADVVADFTFALAARNRIDPAALLGGGWLPRRWMHHHGSPHSAPSGPPRAHPVGVRANGEVEGVPIRFYLGVLVNDQGSVTLTMQARFPAEAIEHDHRHLHPMFEALSAATAVDDRGGTYHAHFSGGGGDGKWDGRLQLTPAPPAGVGWLDMTLPGAPVVRIPMDAPPRDLRVTTEAVTTSAADRFLDAQTAQLMLASASDAAELLASEDTANLFGMAADLLAAGVVTPSSGSLRRLAGAALHFGVRLPKALAAIERADLSADWLGLRARADRQVGPTGIIAVAAVLPEVDGAQCVIGELVSDAASATMQVHARGWPELRHRRGMRVDTFEWTARDDRGGWYVLGNSGGSYSDSEADLDLDFSPALDPEARTLDIILTGPTTRATVTVPLDWQEVT